MGRNDCMNEYFLDSGCTIQFLMLKYLMLFFFLNVVLVLLVKNRQLGIICLVYSFSQIILINQVHVIIRSFVYLFYLPSSKKVRIFVCLFLFIQTIIAFTHRSPFIILYNFYLLIIICITSYQFSTEENEEGEEVPVTKPVGWFKKRPPVSIVADLLLHFIYTMVFLFNKPYGTYIVFMAGSFIPFIQFFYYSILTGDDKDKARLKLSIYFLSYFLIDTPYTFPLRYCVYIAEIWLDENDEISVKSGFKFVMINIFMGVSLFVLFVLCVVNEYTGLVITYLLAMFPMLFVIRDTRGIGIDFLFFLFFCIPLYFNQVSMLWLFFLASLPGLYFSYVVPPPPPPILTEEDLENLKIKNKTRLQLVIANTVENCYIGFVFVLGFGFVLFYIGYNLLLLFNIVETGIANTTPF